jgi:hypothetical protein
VTALEFLHHVVFSVCSAISGECTAYIFRVTEFVQVDAIVQQLRKFCQLWFHTTWQIKATEWGRGDGAFPKQMEVENSEPFSGPQPIRGKIMWPPGAGKWPLIYSLAKCYCYCKDASVK